VPDWATLELLGSYSFFKTAPTQTLSVTDVLPFICHDALVGGVSRGRQLQCCAVLVMVYCGAIISDELH
jgi:hypothetical protein